MFKWLLKQLTEADEDVESLGSERGLEAFLDSLPVTVPMRTVEALGEPFEKAPASELAPARLRRALLRLDERAREPLAHVWNELFEDGVGRTISDTAWLTLARYYRNVGTGYGVCLEAFTQAPTDADRGDAILMACRSMAGSRRSAISCLPKWPRSIACCAALRRTIGSRRTIIRLHRLSSIRPRINPHGGGCVG